MFIGATKTKKTKLNRSKVGGVGEPYDSMTKYQLEKEWNKIQAEKILGRFNRAEQKSMMQEFIEESNGSDIRIFIVDGQVVGSMKRQALPGEFRSNLHRGGKARLVKLTPAERRTAVRAASVMGLNVAGVDLLRSDTGPMVMEVNSSPGMEGIEKATGKDVAGMIIEFIENNAKPKRTRTRGKG